MRKVAVFLGPPRAMPRVLTPDVWFKAVIAPQGKAIPFVLMRQEEPNWCWAAVAQAAEFARRGVAVAQQDIATAHIARHWPGQTCEPPGRWQQNGGACTRGDCAAGCGAMHAVSVVLAERELLGRTLSSGSAVTLADVQAEIAASRPVVCRVEARGTGHFICLAGWWTGADGVPQVLVHDPRNGVIGQPVEAGYMPLADVARRYPMGAAYGINNYSYALA